MKLFCVECEQEFIFTKGEQRFYASHKLQIPKRCPICRKYSAKSMVGMKNNSFMNFVSTCTTPVCVNGGRPSIKHLYVISLKQKANQMYFCVKDKRPAWTDNLHEAAVFTHWTFAQDNIKRLASHMKIDEEYFVAIPYAHWG